MHYTAEQNAKRFFATYINSIDQPIKILEIGSQIGGFNIRSLAPSNSEYIGLDISPAPGVDVVLEDEYVFPFEDNSFDFIISSSCFEHIDFFWVSFLEILRVLKPHGLFYLNAPSTGDYHKYPIDSWRFYPDSGHSLVKWGNKNGINCGLLEYYTSNQENDIWADYIAIFIKDIVNINQYDSRILNSFNSYTNGSIYPHNNILNLKHWK
jgi:SAM-dependent methyltransferase